MTDYDYIDARLKMIHGQLQIHQAAVAKAQEHIAALQIRVEGLNRRVDFLSAELRETQMRTGTMDFEEA